MKHLLLVLLFAIPAGTLAQTEHRLSGLGFLGIPAGSLHALSNVGAGLEYTILTPDGPGFTLTGQWWTYHGSRMERQHDGNASTTLSLLAGIRWEFPVPLRDLAGYVLAQAGAGYHQAPRSQFAAPHHSTALVVAPSFGLVFARFIDVRLQYLYRESVYRTAPVIEQFNVSVALRVW